MDSLVCLRCAKWLQSRMMEIATLRATCSPENRKKLDSIKWRYDNLASDVEATIPAWYQWFKNGTEPEGANAS